MPRAWNVRELMNHPGGGGGGGSRPGKEQTHRERSMHQGQTQLTPTGSRAPGTLTLCNLASHFSLFGSQCTRL